MVNPNVTGFNQYVANNPATTDATGVEQTSLHGFSNDPTDTTGKADKTTQPSAFPNANNVKLPKPLNGAVPIDQVLNTTIPDEVIIANIQELYGEEIQNAVTNGKFTKDEGEKLKNLYLLGKEDSITDPKLQELFQEIQTSVNKQMANKFPNVKMPYPRDSEHNQELATAFKQTVLVKLLQERDDLSPEQKLAIQHYIVSGGKAPTSKAEEIIKALADPIRKTLNEEMAAAGLGGVGIGKDAYLAKIGINFEELVMAKSTDLPPEEQQRFEFLFYHPDASDPTQAKVDQARQESLTVIQQKYGAPASFQPEESSFLYDAKLNGTFYVAVDDFLNNNPQISRDTDKQAVVAYLKAKMQGTEASFDKMQFATTLSLDDVKKLADQALTAGISQVKATYNVSSSWAPDANTSLQTYVGGPGFALVRSLQQMQTILQKHLANDSNLSPEQKITLSDFMKVVSKALSELSELLYQIQAKEAEASRLGSTAQLGMIKDKIEKTKAAFAKHKEIQKENKEIEAKNAQAQKEQQEKAATMEWLTPLLFVVATVITVATLGIGVAAAVGVAALATTMFVLSYVPIGTDENGNKMTALGEAMKGIDKAIVAIAGGIAGAFAAAGTLMTGGSIDEASAEFQAQQEGIAAKVITNILRAALIAVVVAAAIATGNVMIGMMIAGTLIATSGFVEKIFSDMIPQDVRDANPWLVPVLSAITIVTICIVTGGRTAAQAAKKAEDAANGVVATPGRIRLAMNKVGNAISDAAQNVKQTISNALTRAFESGAIQRISNSMKEALADMIQVLKALIAKLRSTNIISKVEEGANKIRQSQTFSEWKGALSRDLMVGVQAGQLVPQMVQNFKQYELSMQMAELSRRIAKLTEDLGMSESQIELIQGIISVFVKFLESISNNMEGIGEFLATTQELMPKNYQVASQATTSLYNSA